MDLRPDDLRQGIRCQHRAALRRGAVVTSVVLQDDRFDLTVFRRSTVLVERQLVALPIAVGAGRFGNGVHVIRFGARGST